MARSAVITRLITQAKAAGLAVTVEEENGDVLQSVSVTIRRPQVEAANMLDVVNNAEWISLHSVRTFNEGRWTNSARVYTYSDYRGSKTTLRRAAYRIQGMS